MTNRAIRHNEINSIIQNLLKGIQNPHKSGSFKKRRLNEENEPFSAKFMAENKKSFNGSNGFKTPNS